MVVLMRAVLDLVAAPSGEREEGAEELHPPLDWPNQPDPFRVYHGAPVVELPRGPGRIDVPAGGVLYRLADGPPGKSPEIDLPSARPGSGPARP